MSHYNAKDTYRAMVFYNSVLKCTEYMDTSTYRFSPYTEQGCTFGLCGVGPSTEHGFLNFSFTDYITLNTSYPSSPFPKYLNYVKNLSYVSTEKFIVNCAKIDFVIRNLRYEYDSRHGYSFFSYSYTSIMHEASSAYIRFFEKSVGSIFKQTEFHNSIPRHIDSIAWIRCDEVGRRKYNRIVSSTP